MQMKSWSARSSAAAAPRGLLAALAVLSLCAGCATMGLKSAVSMKVEREPSAPKDALVYIDEQYIGTLGFVAQRGVRVPEGQHRVSVEKAGYHPYDTLIVSDRQPIALKVSMLKLPD